MGAIKEFYHEEICRMQEDDIIDDEYVYKEQTEDDALNAYIRNIEQDLEDGEYPKSFHSKIS